MTKAQPDNSLKVLIADDDKDDWYFAGLAFKEAGLSRTLNFVVNGEELIDYLQKIHSTGRSQELPDLILLDLNMPKKDGRAALKEIKSDPRFQNLNIVIFSTTISEEDRAYTAQWGASRHIIKPFDFSELVQTVKGLCSDYQGIVS